MLNSYKKTMVAATAPPAFTKPKKPVMPPTPPKPPVEVKAAPTPEVVAASIPRPVLPPLKEPSEEPIIKLEAIIVGM